MGEKSLSLFGGASAATWSRLPEELRSDTLVHEFPKQYSDDYICFSTSDLSLTGPYFLSSWLPFAQMTNAQVIAMLKKLSHPCTKKLQESFLSNPLGCEARRGHKSFPIWSNWSVGGDGNLEQSMVKHPPHFFPFL